MHLNYSHRPFPGALALWVLPYLLEEEGGGRRGCLAEPLLGSVGEEVAAFSLLREETANVCPWSLQAARSPCDNQL